MTLPYSSMPTGALNNGSVAEGYQFALARQRYRGIASLTHGTKAIVFRTNPNSVRWSYKLNTAVENTYGGRVVQLLSTSIQDLNIKIECGLGGWAYAVRIAEFMRNMMVDQRNGQPGLFEYTTRGWRMKVYALNVPFQDRITETTRELELNFRVQEDVTGVISKQTMSAELARLKDGIGFQRSQFNTGTGTLNDGTTSPTIVAPPNIIETLTTTEVPGLDPFARNINSGNLFGLGNLSNIISGKVFGI